MVDKTVTPKETWADFKWSSKVREEPEYMGSLAFRLLRDSGYTTDDMRLFASTLLSSVDRLEDEKRTK